jgi:DMSO/TMAO reductase YedYZ heme-binding membrane subunit
MGTAAPYPGRMAGATGGPGREQSGISRAERVLATMTATVIGLSVLAFIAVLIGSFAGATSGSGIWPLLVALPLVGFPIGFLLMIALIVVNARKRARQARTDR